jgi:hypothetical protein
MFYKKNEENSMSGIFFGMRFWTLLCMGSSKTPQKQLSKKHQKPQKKAPTHLVGVCFGGF